MSAPLDFELEGCGSPQCFEQEAEHDPDVLGVTASFPAAQWVVIVEGSYRKSSEEATAPMPSGLPVTREDQLPWKLFGKGRGHGLIPEYPPQGTEAFYQYLLHDFTGSLALSL